MFALIIGIDEYSDNNIRNLSGAVADANAIEAYLVDTLCIPKAYITVLRNKQATGEAIVNASQGLGEDYRINRGDPILLFYAGHGAQTKTPMDLMEVWSPHISMLIPHDFAPTNSQSRAGQGVLDITLSHCLAEIADKKGDNIVRLLFVPSSHLLLLMPTQTRPSFLTAATPDPAHESILTLCAELSFQRIILYILASSMPHVLLRRRCSPKYPGYTLMSFYRPVRKEKQRKRGVAEELSHLFYWIRCALLAPTRSAIGISSLVYLISQQSKGVLCPEE